MLLSEFLASDYKEQHFVVVLGHPVSHSRSPAIHNAAMSYHNLNVRYYALDCPEREQHLIPELFALHNFRGANVTIPLKKKITSFLDDSDESARDIGAVNTVVPDLQTGQLFGYNTDAYGFMVPLRENFNIRTATILGTGGASRAICYALLKHGVEKLYLVSRKQKKQVLEFDCPTQLHRITYNDLGYAIMHSELIVNCTPVGMHPETEHSPIPDSLMPLLAGKYCYDIIYNPPETTLLQKAKANKALTIDGLDMFIHQAARSFEMWFGKPMPIDLARNVLLDMIKKSRS